MSTPLAIGIDLGTSGARAVVMTPGFEIVAQGAAKLADFGANPRDPKIWWQAVEVALKAVLVQVDRTWVHAIAVDATSGTLLPVDGQGVPLAEPLMYDDKVGDEALLARIAAVIPAESAAHGTTSGLAKALVFQSVPGVAKILHQADWIAGRLAGHFGTTDENNALKTGYDPIDRHWPDWLAAAGLRTALLPRVVAPGAPIETIEPAMAKALGLSEEVEIIAGTTDGCASFLATGADRPGDGVTALGSTLTLKLLCDRPIFAPEFGIYSHRLNGMWLAGGASNSGGKVLSHFFSADEIVRLSAAIDPDVSTGLDFYPLLEPGERFPVLDPAWPPRLTPRPADDAGFLQAMLEGISTIEKLGYDRLAELGAPPLQSMRSLGGGASNPAWTAIRQNRLGVPFPPAHSQEAAAGTARLALIGLEAVGDL
ncbi:carbohydrate kinase (plasmid) [Aminobacter sp. Y103A]|jgi:sugar (pentulose or hexulose) kinase|uniref:FGGY-family carbohydrate kinase n=1 Tax=Aminobacter TaxID=31988 RepID=UPI0025724219|nr:MULTISPECIES: FGGY-family carbohydrate kinase [Aminobacter]WMD00481.1 FGGY-family carbohydrate kinase [Aminobacter niigataensis]BBD40561.1 carbohydrate kinase [Aminobacter sp. SS-2016]